MDIPIRRLPPVDGTPPPPPIPHFRPDRGREQPHFEDPGADAGDDASDEDTTKDEFPDDAPPQSSGDHGEVSPPAPDDAGQRLNIII